MLESLLLYILLISITIRDLKYYLARHVYIPSYSSHNDYITKKKFIVTNLGLIIVAKIKNSLLPCAPPSYRRPFYRDRKGSVTQNCLFACSLALKFIYALTGWEGTGTDALLWQDALEKGLLIPEQKYLLGDAGFSASPKLLIPYQGVQYHLAEWGCAHFDELWMPESEDMLGSGSDWAEGDREVW